MIDKTLSYNNDMKTLLINLPSIEDIDFKIECLEEFEHPNNCFALDDESQEEVVGRILRDLENGNEWAWCSVRVVGNYRGITGKDYLGGCSHESEEDFKDCGYFEDMKMTAYNEIIKKLEALA